MLAFAALRADVTVVDGHISMRNRPNKDLMDALATLGARIESARDGHLPTTVTGSRALRGPVRVPGTISSQYLTSLLIIAPLIRWPRHRSRRRAHQQTLRRSHARRDGQVRRAGRKPGLPPSAGRPQTYRAGSIDVEGDASAASYFAALATLHGASMTLTNLGAGTRQGDYAFFGLCERLGARVTRSAATTIIQGPRKLDTAFDAAVDMTSMPDVAPTLMMIAPFLKQATRITGLATLRVKECDRIAAPDARAAQAGREVEEGPDYMVIAPLDARATRQTRTGRGNRDLSRSSHRHVLRRARIAVAGPPDPGSGLRGQDLPELLARLAARAFRCAPVMGTFLICWQKGTDLSGWASIDGL